jgi:hypothetical protein
MFAAQVVSGMQEIAARQLQREDFAPVTVIETEDGLVVFEPGRITKRLFALPYVNNSFRVLYALESLTIGASLEGIARERSWHPALRASVRPEDRSFRLILSDENRLVSGESGPIDAIVSAIRDLTGLRYVPRGGGAEFWVLRRRTGAVFFARRVSRRRKTERDLGRGELRPELASLLCLLSEPSAADIFLDPFAGSGAIPLARAELPFNMIFASDLDPARVKEIKEKLKQAPPRKARGGAPFIVRVSDARNLVNFQDGFVDKIVTDPPWGLYKAAEDAELAGLYRGAMAEFCRVMKPGGVLVLLLGRGELSREASGWFPELLAMEEQHEILVAGQKATVLKWKLTGITAVRPFEATRE